MRIKISHTSRLLGDARLIDHIKTTIWHNWHLRNYIPWLVASHLYRLKLSKYMYIYTYTFLLSFFRNKYIYIYINTYREQLMNIPVHAILAPPGHPVSLSFCVSLTCNHATVAVHIGTIPKLLDAISIPCFPAWEVNRKHGKLLPQKGIVAIASRGETKRMNSATELSITIRLLYRVLPCQCLGIRTCAALMPHMEHIWSSALPRFVHCDGATKIEKKRPSLGVFENGVLQSKCIWW